ncbi:hypothetical protein ACVW00_002739 [Marmoricola sp. URHA0025 HA25]
MRFGVRRLLVVLAVAGAGFVPAPASAAGYCSGSGINVVVDRGALGGGIATDCDASGNRNAARAFENTGHHLSYAQRQPGFVCKVDGVPTSDPCFNTSPADAYWGLYWSDGTSGWKYSSVAVGSLTVPAGATVAFSWQNGGDADLPGTAPAPPPSAAQPSASASTVRPKTTPTTARPTAHASVAAPASGSATPSTSASPSVTPSATASATPSAAATVSASTTPSASASVEAATGSPETTLDPVADSGDGLPWWLPVGSVVVLGGVAGAVWRVRRARL